MKRTNTYQLETFETGGFYFASSDYRRFTTLDYNLKKYIGIVGNGILRGWDIEILSGLTIKINPGCGFISGLYTESPWVIDQTTNEPKRKNQAVIDGDDIFEEIPGWSSQGANNWVGGFYNIGGSSVYDALVFDKLGPDGEDNNFDGIIDGVLQPHYKEPPDNYFTNPFVKAVPTHLTTFYLEDNADNYVFAEKVNLNPNESFASFFISENDVSSDNNLLLAKVSVRNGSILKVSYDGILKAKSLESASGEITKRLLKQHIHGGTENWDPPRIRLETDIRKCFFVGINDTGNVFGLETDDPDFINGCIFAILSSNETEQSQDINHSHYYEMDSDGNGFTHYINSMEKTLSKDFHYHIIETNIVDGESVTTLSMVGNYNAVPHTHTVGKNSNITDLDNIVVRINDNVIYKKDYKTFLKNGVNFIIVKNSIASFKNGKYESEIELINKAAYSFQEESGNIASFISDMMINFNNKFQNETSYISSAGASQKITVRTPFTFQTDVNIANLENGESNYVLSDPTPVNTWPTGIDGTLYKFTNASTDLFLQSIIIGRNLVNSGDEAMAFPNIARFIPIKVLEKNSSEEIEVEILGEVEVTKWLNLKNIFFIDAENFKNGKFLPEYIPFLSHTGQLSIDFASYQSNTFSNNSSEFKIVPILSSLSNKHYHKVWMDKYGNGTTSGTFIDDKISVYKNIQVTVDGVVQLQTVLVEHIHEIESGIIKSSISSGINQYNNNATGLSHSHYAIQPQDNNSTSVFYIGDDKDGNIFLGTSNGLQNKLKNNGYEINIEGNLYYYEVGDLLVSLLKATYQNFLCTQRYASFSSSYAQTIEATLNSIGDNATIPTVVVFLEEKTQINSEGTTTATTSESSARSNIIINIVDVFKVSDFNRIKTMTYETYNAEDEDILYQKTDGTIVTMVNFHKQPIWSGCLLDNGSKFFISQKKVIRNVVNDQGEYWEEIFITTNPFNIARKVIKSGDYLLVCGDNGVKKLNINNPSTFIDTSLNLDVYDIIWASSTVVLATTKNGLYKTNDNGLTWSSVLTTSDLKEITRDYSLDKTTIKDTHYHYLITDINGYGYTSDAYLESGLPYSNQHIHEINSWLIQNNLDHNHDIISTLFFRTKNNEIFKSIDSGDNWVNITIVPPQYNAETIFAAFGNLFVGTYDSLIYYNGSAWIETNITNRVFCFNWTHNLNGFYIGCNNKSYISYDGITITDCIVFNEDLLPVCFVNQQEEKNGFVYNNLNKSINFRDVLSISDIVNVSQNYDLMISQTVNTTAPYDIIINNSTVLSTKDNIDIRKTSGFDFDFNTNTGVIDFSSQTTLSSNINYGDNVISVKSSDDFDVGKEIIIYKVEEFKLTGLISTDEKYFYQKEFKGKIVAVSTGTITLECPIYDNIEATSIVKQIYKLTEEPDVVVNYYENYQITNVGNKTHEEIEDSLSNKSINMPFKLSEVLLNNFNQISLYTKYGLPTIDNNFKNWQCFFMRYDRSSTSENYIGNFFDIEQSNLQNSSILTGLFNPLLSSSINKIYFGRNDYKEMVFVGTNNGLYAGIPSNNFNNDWFLIPSNTFSQIYDIMSLDNFKVLVLAENGVFINQDSSMTKWAALSNVINNSGFFIKYRWINFGNESNTNWWSQWNYEENIEDINITNSFILGGRNFVAISNNNGSSWSTSILKDNDNKYFTSYDATTLLPLSSGSALLVLNNVSQSNMLLKNSILETNGLGDKWNSEVFSFQGYTLIVNKIEITEQNNTKVSFVEKTNTFMAENSLVGLSVFIKDQKTFVVSNSSENIILRGTNISLYINKNDEIKINPIKINSIIETKDNALIIGTECGLFYDGNSYANKGRVIGTINGVGKEAVVLNIDISGFIASVSENNVLEEDQTEVPTTEILCILDKNVDTNELVGKKFQFLNEIVPIISITSPLPNASIESTTVTVNINVSMFDVTTSGFLALQIDNGSIQYFNSTNFTIKNLTYGEHKLTVFLTDVSKIKLPNSFAEKTVYFTNKANGQDPYIVIEYPLNNEIIKSSSFYAKIKIYNFNTFFEGFLAYAVDGGSVSIIPYQPNGIYSVLFNSLTIEKHSIEFMLLDTNNKEIGVNQTVSFSLSNDYPSIFILSPVNNSSIATTSISLSYDISNFNVPSNGQVKIIVTNEIEGNEVNNTYYSTDQLSYQLVGLIEGSNTIKVQLVDNNLRDITGDFTSCISIITVNTSLQSTPSLAIFTPQNGSVIETGMPISIYFTISNFDIPTEGGILIYINNNIETFWTKTDPYIKTFSTDGTYVISAVLAKSAEEKLTNSQANAQVTITSIAGITTITTNNILTTETTAAVTATTATTIAATTASTEQQAALVSNTSYFSIVSNSASSASGLTLIKVGGSVSQAYANMYFKIFGNSSVLYVEYISQVVDHEFDGGKVYVSGDQQNNIYSNYNIKSQIGNQIELVETISINSSQTNLDVQKGQTILIVPVGDKTNLWINLDKNYGENEFANMFVYFDGIPNSEIKVISNTQRSMSINTDIIPSRIKNGTALCLNSLISYPLKTFNNKKTTLENSHYHMVTLIDGFLTGGIESINKLNTGYIVVYIKDTVGFNNSIVINHPDLLKGGKITFYPSSNSIVTYYDIIDSVYSDRIIIKTQNEDIWNIDHFKSFGIDATFLFEINAKYYGETTTVYYDDFYIYKTSITQDALSLQSFVYVDNTASFNINDNVIIFNNKEKKFYSKIKDIVDEYKLELLDPLDYSFLVVDDSCISIYKTGTSSNSEFISFNHEHLIRNCEVSLTTVNTFDQSGYPTVHDHGLSNLIGSVKNIIEQYDDGRTIVSGNNSIIYYSDDGGDTWQELIDVKDYISSQVFGESIYVTSLDVDSFNDLIIGTNVGIIIRQGLDNPNVALLNYPFTEEWLPSSSSSSSSSSESSYSTGSTSSSITSLSTSSSSELRSSSSVSNTSGWSSSSSLSNTTGLSSSSSSSYSRTSGRSSSSTSSCSTYWHA